MIENTQAAKSADAGWLRRNWLTIAFIIVLGTYLRLAIKLANGLDFNDETEKLIVAMMIDHGRRLYSHIFVQHGPFTYMLSHIFYEIFRARNIAASRSIPIAMALLTTLAVMKSPALVTRKARLVAGCVLLLGYGFTQAIYAEVMTMYQIYAAYLFTIALALMLLPFIAGFDVKRHHAVIAGLCLASIFFCGFSFAISIFFCLLLCLTKYLFDRENRVKNGRLIAFMVAGGVLGLAIVLGWLTVFGSIEGYIVDHFYFNLVAYQHYLIMSPYKPLRFMVPGWSWRSAPDKATWYTHFVFALVPIYSAMLILAMARRKDWTRIYQYPVYYILLLLAVVYMDPRYELHIFASTLVMVAFAIVAMTTAMIFDLQWEGSYRRFISRANVVGLAFVVIASIAAQYTLVTYVYGLSPIKYYRHRDPPLARVDSPQMNFLRRVVGQDEPVQQFPFNLNFYIQADRLPAFDAFYWMPWQADNAKHPLWKGYEFNLCKDMIEAPPKAVYYVEDRVWGHSPDSFMGCVKDTLRKKYLRTGRFADLWIRADVVADNDEALQWAMVPMNYDASWLSPEQAARINAMKREYKALSSPDGRSCLQKPLAPHSDLRVGQCSGPDVLYFSFKRNAGTDTELLTLPDDECVDLNIDMKGPIKPFRLWPCTQSQVQAFTILPQPNGGMRLEDKQTDRCIAIAGTKVIGGNCDHAPAWTFTDVPLPEEPATNFGYLMSLDTIACLKIPSGVGLPVGITSCDDPSILNLDLYTSDNGTRILTLPNYECVDVGESKSAEAPITLAKCSGGLSQTFDLVPYQYGLILRSLKTNLCLDADGTRLIEKDCAAATQWR